MRRRPSAGGGDRRKPRNKARAARVHPRPRWGSAMTIRVAATGLAVVFGLALDAMAAEVAYYPVSSGTGPHDVAPAPDGTVWYTGQRKGFLGRLDPKTHNNEEI